LTYSGAKKFYSRLTHKIDTNFSALLHFPDLVVVPAHDAAAQEALGYFPNWVR